MKAAFRSVGDKVVLRRVPRRELGPNDIRVKVEACGVCGTDLHQDPAQTGERRFGHEIAGTVLETGCAVQGLETGQAIALDSATPCGGCAQCKNGNQDLCTNIRSFFCYGELGFAEEVVAPALSALPYAGMTPAVASLQEPLGVAIDMVRLATIRPLSNVLVFGAGPIGLMALVLAKLQGAGRVFVCQRPWRTARCALARAWGAAAVLAPADLADYDFGCRIDRVLVTTPPDTLAAAVTCAAAGAIISYIGIGYGEQAVCRLDGNLFHFKKLQLRASFASPARFGPLAVEYLQRGVVAGEALISHTFGLNELGCALATAATAAAAIKVVVTP